MGCSHVKHRAALLIQIFIILDLVRCTEAERTGHTLREHTRGIGFQNLELETNRKSVSCSIVDDNGAAAAITTYSKTMITSDFLAFSHQLLRQSLATESGWKKDLIYTQPEEVSRTWSRLT